MSLFDLDPKLALTKKPVWATNENPWYAPCPIARTKRLVFCVDIGNTPWSAISAASRAKYAASVGADCITSRRQELYYDGVVWQKFAVYKYLQQGYTVLSIDNDAIITKDCPDVFSFPEGFWYVAKDHNSVVNKGSEKGVIDSIKETDTALNANTVITDAGFNAGVMLISPRQKRFFAPGPWIQHLWGSSLVEQAYLNVCALAYPKIANLHYLPLAFNCVHPCAGQHPWIVHAAGRPDKEKFLTSWANA